MNKQEKNRLIVLSLAARPGCQRQGAEIFIMKIMTLIGSILESLQKNMASRAHLRECSIHFRQEKSTGDMWRLS